ncbi:hypothetical protein K469DRAFT_744625 [Zopfia rhizophila CBS 207.26]|uniref:Uncharacterized protein n=1 Tax=Zopfia rhizophila CBS 207.26 TaxID=1314779 RepID=A0A6A6ETE0_9PEZI|nr:hypothetical protein K469DRAFT_744625 [Zopfia rhizophila CBS 207.26]
MDLLVRSLALTGTRVFPSANATTAHSSVRFANSTTSPTVSTGLSILQTFNSSALRLSNAGVKPEIGNITSFIAAPTAAPFANSTGSIISSARNASIDFNNATECWHAYWSYTQATNSWSTSNLRIETVVQTRSWTITSRGPEISDLPSNVTVLCDGLPRFGSEEEADVAFEPILLPEPSVTTQIYATITYIWSSTTFPPQPSCTISGTAECAVVWSMFGSSLSNSIKGWSSTNVLTISLASPPTSVVVNGEPTPLTAAPGAFPILTLHGEEYEAIKDTYTVSSASNLYGEVTLTPGDQQVLTWNWEALYPKPFGPPNGRDCQRPDGNIISSQCVTAQCTLRPQHVELLYFPPPSSSSDICANTSPGYNSYSVSVFSQPHASTVINSTTYWSDKAYVRYKVISAYKFCDLDNMLGRTSVGFGNTFSDQVIEVASSHISSICDWQYAPGAHIQVIGATAKPLNFNDLDGPIPASAYQCGIRCQSGCQSIVTPFWIPFLAVPPEVRTLDPNWASCVPYFEGTPDPPIALASKSFLASTTSNVPVQSDPPAPGVTPEPAGPDPTTNPQPPQNPPDPPPNPADPQDPSNTPQNPPRPPPNPVTVPFTETIPLPSGVGEGAPVNNAPPTPITSIGGSVVNADPSHPGTIIIQNPQNPGAPAQTIVAGGSPVVIGGTTLSIAPTGAGRDGGGLVVSGNTGMILVSNVGGQPVFIDPSRPGIVLIGDPAGPLQTLSTSRGNVVVAGTTVSLSPTGVVTANSNPGSVMIFNISFTFLPDGGVLINNSQVLKLGDPAISINGHNIFVPPSGGVLVIDGQTYRISSDPSSPPTTTIQNIPLSLLPDGTLLIGGVTILKPGDAPVQFAGHTISLDPSGAVIIDGLMYKIDPTTSQASGILVVVGPDGITSTVKLPYGVQPTKAPDLADILASYIVATATEATTKESGGSKSEGSNRLPSTTRGVITSKGGAAGTATGVKASSTKSDGRRTKSSMVWVWLGMVMGFWLGA